MTPYFSVVISLYNKEKHIQSTIESVLAQSFVDFEIVVVNDGSTDNSEAIVRSINDKRIQIYSQENKGVSAARNLGIEKAKAELVAFLDADDYWYPNHLETLKTLYKILPNCGLYATAYVKQFNTVKINSIYKNIPTTPNWMGIVADYFESSQINSIAWTSAVMIPKKVFDTIGNFDTKITLGAGEDTDLWIRVGLKYDVGFCNTVTAIHNLHSDNRVSNTNTNMRQFINLDAYEATAHSKPSLKKYLDFNRYSIAKQYKLVNNNLKARELISKIDFNNLNWKQQLLLKMNNQLLRIFIKVKLLLRNLGCNLSSYK
ncbi:Putative glycosyltransferase EpsH [Mariniflexile rhizosphaerae]|uniref:glycosyltransferase family 2 protein n=1 Tax=unclassified Mariniflexile TaxID=2643887 RepID=UPI000CB2E740|nr:glycosyltransferase family A protein [Mariniflexile sp. TRM1-10]AXP81729.1 Putative glycosyltransferase EpsH [Mariniflexile sp. TRM1-10]PLB20891.1 MAG: Glycosyl transferase family 2 [Flavobacteriaceae bacterium FS1-H7996/R]